MLFRSLLHDDHTAVYRNSRTVPPTLAAYSDPPRFMSAPLANVGDSHTPTFGGARTSRNCAIGRKARTVMIDTQPFVGQHCETTTVGTLLGQLGIHLSEPMLFGLGEGLGYTIWKMKTMDFPFLGGRIKPDLITENIAKNLGLLLTVKETTSRAKAWRRVKELLDAGRLVGLKLDCYHLEYFSQNYQDRKSVV